KNRPSGEIASGVPTHWSRSSRAAPRGGYAVADARPWPPPYSARSDRHHCARLSARHPCRRAAGRLAYLAWPVLGRAAGMGGLARGGVGFCLGVGNGTRRSPTRAAHYVLL